MIEGILDRAGYKASENAGYFLSRIGGGFIVVTAFDLLGPHAIEVNRVAQGFFVMGFLNGMIDADNETDCALLKKIGQGENMQAAAAELSRVHSITQKIVLWPKASLAFVTCVGAIQFTPYRLANWLSPSHMSQVIAGAAFIWGQMGGSTSVALWHLCLTPKEEG